MAILDLIQVRIRSNGEFLTEYDDPDEDAPHDTMTTTKFIEATPGAKFSIEVSIMPGYDPHGSDGVHVSRRMDGQPCCSEVFCKSSHVNSVTRGWTRNIEIDLRFDDKSGHWIESSFSFGQVEILEHSELPDDYDPQMAVQLGTIELAFYRVHRRLLRVPLPISKIPLFTTVDQTSEKILKGKAIDNNIRSFDSHVVPQPAADTHENVRAHAPYGLTTVFRFHYRSHRALQILGCIPRSESPAIVIQPDEEAETNPAPAISDSNSPEVGLSQRAKERIRLQEELARLDRLDRESDRGKVETDSKFSSDGQNVRPNLKREHEENDVLIKRESGSKKRVRTSGPVKIIDLTDD